MAQFVSNKFTTQIGGTPTEVLQSLLLQPSLAKRCTTSFAERRAFARASVLVIAKKKIRTNRQAIQQVSSLYKVSQGTSPSKAKQNSSKKKRNKKLKKPERYLGENAAYC
jgi:hypothetical protein